MPLNRIKLKAKAREKNIDVSDISLAGELLTRCPKNYSKNRQEKRGPPGLYAPATPLANIQDVESSQLDSNRFKFQKLVRRGLA